MPLSQNIKDGIEYFTNTDRSMPTASPFFWHLLLDDVPFLICQIRWIGRYDLTVANCG